MVILNAAATLMTYSRAGAVALAAAFLLIAWRSRHRVVILVALTLVTVPLALMLGQTYIDRLATLKAPTEEASALSRLVLAKAGLKLWADHPWLGVGFGRQNQQLLLPRYMPEWWEGFQGFVIHNTWIQLLTDSGIFAFLLYVLLYLSCLWWLGRVFRRSRKDQSPWAPYAAGLHTSLAAFGVGATFGSRVDFDLYYILIATVAALYEIRRTWSPAEEVALETETAPVATRLAISTLPPPGLPAVAPAGRARPGWRQPSWQTPLRVLRTGRLSNPSEQKPG
jgi:O-antigen ligase